MPLQVIYQPADFTFALDGQWLLLEVTQVVDLLLVSIGYERTRHVLLTAGTSWAVVVFWRVV
jgi:hypothetical protein